MFALSLKILTKVFDVSALEQTAEPSFEAASLEIPAGRANIPHSA